MSQLPEDVWFRIARLLTVETRRKIFGLNRVFFQLGIKDRYETATFARSDGQTKRLCAQLRYALTFYLRIWQANNLLIVRIIFVIMSAGSLSNHGLYSLEPNPTTA